MRISCPIYAFMPCFLLSNKFKVAPNAAPHAPARMIAFDDNRRAAGRVHALVRGLFVSSQSYFNYFAAFIPRIVATTNTTTAATAILTPVERSLLFSCLTCGEAGAEVSRETVARVAIFPPRPTFRTRGIHALRVSKSDGGASCHSSTYTSPPKTATPVGDHGLGACRMVLTSPLGVILRTRRLPVAATYTSPCGSTANPRQ